MPAIDAIDALVRARFPASEVREAPPWLRIRMDRLPPGLRSGWKLHLSSTPAQYEAMMTRALPCLDALGLPFKLLRTPLLLETMNDGGFGLMQVGKAATVYPPSEALAHAAAQSLAGVLDGLQGPHIPSDFQFAPNAPVYYRFGPFDFRFIVDVSGQRRRLLFHPRHGELFDDPAFSETPDTQFLPPPVPYDHLEALRPHFLFLRCLQLSAKGATFLAAPREAPDRPVLLKTAKAGAQSDLLGRDAVWALNREHALLERLANTGICPDPGVLFPLDRVAALARPFVPGDTFWQCWTAPDARSRPARRQRAHALEVLCRVVATAHDRGVLLRDLSPTNVILAEGQVMVVDLESAHPVDDPEPPFRRGTLGFYDPGDLDPLDQDTGAVPSPASMLPTRFAAPLPAHDWYAVRALALMSHAGVHPAWWSRSPAAEQAVAIPMAPAFRECWEASTAPAEGTVAALCQHAGAAPAPSGAGDPAASAQASLFVSLRHALAAPIPDSGEVDAHNVYTGHAGLILALAELGPEALEQAIAELRIEQIGLALAESATRLRHIPGMYFGASGIGLALVAAGHSRKSETLLELGHDLLLHLPVEQSQVPDLCQGLAGLVAATLRAARITRDGSFLAIAVRAGERVLELAVEEEGLTWWRWPEGPFPLSNARHLGFAHGVAGVVYALCELHHETGETAFAQGAEAGLRTLERTAQSLPEDGLWWPASQEDRTVWNAWCHGTPGVIKALAQAVRCLGHEGARMWLPRALHGMNQANNAGWCLCHGVASRLDARGDALDLLDARVREVHLAAGHQDARLLASLDTDWLVRAAQLAPGAQAEGTGVMTGPVGLLRSLLRWEQAAAGDRPELNLLL